MIEYCEKNRDNCIVLLKTPLVGKEVDNGMGVDFDLKEFAIICKDEDVIPNEVRFEKAQIFEVHRLSSVDEFIQELKGRDQYEVIWRNNDYKEPDKIKSELVRCGFDFELKINLYYKLKVNYDEIKKYYKERSKPSPWQSDLFSNVLEDMKGFEKLVGRYFPLDRAKLDSCYYTADGIEFSFVIPKKEEINPDYVDDMKEKQLEIQQKIEDCFDGSHDSKILKQIISSIKEKLKEGL